MAIFYTLIVVGETSQAEMADRLGLRFESRGRVWTTVELGFIITLHRSTNGYYEFGERVFKPKRHLHVGFRVHRDYDYDAQEQAANLIRFVDRALETGAEDMVLVQLGETLLLERAGNTLRQTDAGFWNNVR